MRERGRCFTGKKILLELHGWVPPLAVFTAVIKGHVRDEGAAEPAPPAWRSRSVTTTFKSLPGHSHPGISGAILHVNEFLGERGRHPALGDSSLTAHRNATSFRVPVCPAGLPRLLQEESGFSSRVLSSVFCTTRLQTLVTSSRTDS